MQRKQFRQKTTPIETIATQQKLLKENEGSGEHEQSHVPAIKWGLQKEHTLVSLLFIVIPTSFLNFQFF